MYRLIRFLILGVWAMPPKEPKHSHKWAVLRQGQNNYGPITVLQCMGCGECKIVK